MAKKSRTSRPTDNGELGFDPMPLDFDLQDDPEETREALSLDQIDERERRLADQVGWQEARAKARDGGFVTEVIGTSVELAAITQTVHKRLALFSRDRQARDQLFEEFAAAHDDGPIVFLPAEAVLESERLLEALHKAVCSRVGLDESLPVEDVISHLLLNFPGLL